MLKLPIHLSLAFAFLSLAGFVPTSGQTTPVLPATNAPTTNAPSATPPASPIALGDVVTQAQLATTKLRSEQNSLATDQTAQGIGDNLPDLARQIDDRMAEDARLLEAVPSLSNLQNAQIAWRSLANHVASSQDTLSQQAASVDALMIELNQMKTTWEATRDSIKKVGTPPEAAQPVNTVLAALADTIKAAQISQAAIFSVQAGLGKQASRISDGASAITKAEKTARQQLLQQNHPPLWKVEEVRETSAGIIAQEKVTLHTQVAELKIYLKDKMPVFLVHLLLLALLIIGFHWIRNAIRLHAETEAALHHAARVFDVPMATGLLFALLATGWLYPAPPRLLLAAAGATGLIPAVIIIRRLIDQANFSLLYATVIAYFVDQLRFVITPAGILSRFLFILELLAASIFLLTALRSKHLANSPLEPNRLKRFTRIYLHLAFAVLVFAGFANVFGYVRLSVLVGNGMLDSSYLAIIVYAAVRIADALVISALSVRPLTRLGMVRRHQELLENNLSKSIRWLAFAFWIVMALQLFSVRDLLWQEARRLLDTNLPWFSIKIPLHNIVAFPITIWASFLLSRFIRFALEEEVYPNLNLSRGIPYAASTMVHYAILVIGFFVAVKAGGAELTQFSFLAGAFGVGLGFGLQNIFNNFVSGIILLFERPIKVGDVVQIDANVGKVESIGIRASIILLANGSELIVPNGNLISNQVTNWTLSNYDRLIEIPVNVASKVDPQHVINLLTEVARAHPDVLKNPPPQALLLTFSGAALNFQLRAWTDSEEEWKKLASDLSLAINAALAKENIAMA